MLWIDANIYMSGVMAMALTRLRKEIDAAVQRPVFDLSREELVQEALDNHEGVLAANGALRAVTGRHTGRSPKDKFFVDDEYTHDVLCWDNNQAWIQQDSGFPNRNAGLCCQS